MQTKQVFVSYSVLRKQKSNIFNLNLVHVSLNYVKYYSILIKLFKEIVIPILISYNFLAYSYKVIFTKF